MTEYRVPEFTLEQRTDVAVQLQLFWNHHEFEWGKRVGSSPLELAGVEDVPSLAEVLDRLFHPSVAAQPA